MDQNGVPPLGTVLLVTFGRIPIHNFGSCWFISPLLILCLLEVYIYTATCIHHQHPGIWYNTPLWSMICVCYATCIQHIFQSFFFIHPLILHALVHQARICLVNLGYNFVIAMQNPLPTLTWRVLWLKVHHITHVTLPSMSSSVRITTFRCALRATTQCFLCFGAVWGTMRKSERMQRATHR